MLIVGWLKEEVLIMAKAIFKVLLKFIKSVVDLILSPINLLVVNLFPNLSNLLNTFNSSVSSVLGSSLGWFAHLLPPTTKSIVLFYLGILISYYTVTVTVHGIIKVIHIIKQIKIW